MSSFPDVPYNHRYRWPVSEYPIDRISNAVYFARWLLRAGWKLPPICAVLGNWQAESYLNTNYPQREDFPISTGGGFGLPHWSPWFNKYGIWAYETYGLTATATDDNPLADFALQMEYHEYSITQGEWFSNQGYAFSWSGFKVAEDQTIDTLTRAYYWQYERSASGDPDRRVDYALWYRDFFAENPITPLPAEIPIWLLFKIKKRR